MRTLVKEKLLWDSDDPFGRDSVQGLLELANWFEHSPHFRIFSPEGDDQDPDSFYADIARLQKDGYVEAIWIDSHEPNERYQLQSLTLTISGHKFLAELREKSAAGRLKRRLSDLSWTLVVAILTSIVTTLVTLNVGYK